jgi:hypothetical protein
MSEKEINDRLNFGTGGAVAVHKNILGRTFLKDGTEVRKDPYTGYLEYKDTNGNWRFSREAREDKMPEIVDPISLAIGALGASWLEAGKSTNIPDEAGWKILCDTEWTPELQEKLNENFPHDRNKFQSSFEPMLKAMRDKPLKAAREAKLIAEETAKQEALDRLTMDHLPCGHWSNSEILGNHDVGRLIVCSKCGAKYPIQLKIGKRVN